jgi:hypothetical protein
MFMHILSYIFSGVASMGTILNIKKKKSGFIFWLISNAFFSIYNIFLGEIGMFIVFISNMIFTIYGYYSWNYQDKRRAFGETNELQAFGDPNG